jgi:hypothetical protein
MIVDRASGEPVMGDIPLPFSMNLDQVEGLLSRHERCTNATQEKVPGEKAPTKVEPR